MPVEPDDPLPLRLRFSLREDGEDLQSIGRELTKELDDLRRREGVRGVRVEPGDIGVGYSGPGFEIIIEVARFAFDDIARLVELGIWTTWIVDRVRSRRKRATIISDGPTLGAVAAAQVAPTRSLTGYRFISCRPLTGWPEAPDETDERFVWAAVFEDDSRGEVLVVFISPAGLVLGQVIVPLHVYIDDGEYNERSEEAVRHLFIERNS